MNAAFRKLRSKLWPETHLLNPEFPYVPACKTDVARTIRVERFRQELARRMKARKGDTFDDIPF